MNQEKLILPPVINGLWQIADMERLGATLDQGQLNQAIDTYVAQGFNTFDMADHYGSAELIMGAYCKEKPKAGLTLLTKWVPKPGEANPDDTRSAIQLALQRLQTSQLDLLQYHAWNYADPTWLDQLIQLQGLQDEGLIRHLGLTNTDAAHLQMVLETGIPIRTNQLSYSLLDRRAQGKMTEVCRQYGISILAFGTLAGGFLTERWLGQAEPTIEDLSTWSQMKYKRYIDQIGGWRTYQQVLAELKDLADHYKMSLANLASGYILKQPAVSSVIIGCRLGQSEHLTDNQRLRDLPFPDELLSAVDHVLETLIPLPGNCGDEYRQPPFLTAAGDLSDHLDQLPAPYLVVEKAGGRRVVFSGTPWEKLAGYSRAVLENGRIHVSGTTATHENRVIGGLNPYCQTHFIIDKIAGALQSFGADLEQVVRTRIFVKNKDQWEPVARAHGERFAGIDPANTLVQADLIGDDYLVEIEAEAVLQ